MRFLKGQWFINKKGISLNEGGRFITLSIIRNFNEKIKWYIHFFLYIPIIKKQIIIDKYYD